MIDFIKSKGVDIPIDTKEFESKVGIGIEIKESDIQATIDKILDGKKKFLEVERYKFKYVNVIHEIKKEFAYLDTKLAKELLIKTIEKRLGPKTNEELKEDSFRTEFEKLKEKKK